MLSAQISFFDLAVLGVMLLSCLFAFFRGFVKEVLSLGAWIGAGVITLYFFRDVAEMLKPHFTSETVAGGMATLGLYVTSLIGFSLLNALIIRFVKEGSDVGFLDNTLGLLFGAFRGGFIVSLGYLMMSMVVDSGDKENQPKWLQSSWTQPYAEEGAILLARIAPDFLQEHSSLREKIEDAEEGIPHQEKRSNAQRKLVEMSHESGYRLEKTR